MAAALKARLYPALGARLSGVHGGRAFPMAPLFACLQPLPSSCTVGGITTVRTDCGALASSPSSYRKIGRVQAAPLVRRRAAPYPMPSHPWPPQAPEVETISVRCSLVPSHHLFVNRSTDRVSGLPSDTGRERKKERSGRGEEQLETFHLGSAPIRWAPGMAHGAGSCEWYGTHVVPSSSACATRRGVR